MRSKLLSTSQLLNEWTNKSISKSIHSSIHPSNKQINRSITRSINHIVDQSTVNLNLIMWQAYHIKGQGWRSGESARLPIMCPGFDSRTRGLFLEGSGNFSGPESHSKISNLLITELFYSQILNMNRGSLYTRSGSNLVSGQPSPIYNKRARSINPPPYQYNGSHINRTPVLYGDDEPDLERG